MEKQVVKVTLRADILTALDAWIAAQTAAVTRAQAIVLALEDWLVVQRALGMPETSEQA